MGRAGLTTARVVAAGENLADRIGFRAVTIAALARELGVRPASLYVHVRDLDDLRVRIALHTLAELADRAAHRMAGLAGRDALVALATAYRDFAREHPGRYASMRHPLSAEVASTSAGPRHTELTAAVLRGYGLAPAEIPHAVRTVGSLIHGFVELEASGSFGHSSPASEQSWTRALDALDAALTHWPATPSSAPGPRRPPHDHPHP